MVAFNDLQRAFDLKSESLSIDSALRLLAHGDGRIVGMLIEVNGLTVGSMRPLLANMRANITQMNTGAPANNAVIDTTGWQYPQQMVAAITQQLNARRDAIDKELESMGVTEVHDNGNGGSNVGHEQ